MTSIAAALPFVSMAWLAQNGGWGEFEKNPLLGEGGSARVVASKNPVTSSPCAIKFGGPSLEREYWLLSELLREAPHTIRAKGFLNAAEKAALAMERLNGPDLCHLAQQNPNEITFSVFFRIAKRWLEALAYYESLGLVHGDVKPENCAYNLKTEELTIFDFGLAFFPASEKCSKGATLNYIAPEMMWGDRSYASDMWALGVALFFIYTGRHMFLGPGGQKCKDKNELAWSFAQHFKDSFVISVGRMCCQKNDPRFFEGMEPLEQKLYCLAAGREEINSHIKERALSLPPVPWRQRIYEAAQKKGESSQAQHIIDFLEKIFIPADKRMTPQEGLEHFPLSDKRDSDDGLASSSQESDACLLGGNEDEEAAFSHLQSAPLFFEHGDWRHWHDKCMLGRGSHGIVYAARNPHTGSPWAVKLGDSSLAREYEILVGPLRNAPHTVRAKGLCSSAGKTILALERLFGPDLFDLSSRNSEKITFPVCCSLAKKLLEALESYGEQRIVHSDIKPENCFFNPKTRRLRIIDFGLSLSVNGYWEDGGTLQYMAPEMILPGNADVGCEADMWAAGATLFFAYTGKLMFSGPGGRKCRDSKDLLWSYLQQSITLPFAEVGTAYFKEKSPQDLDGLSEEERQSKCLEQGIRVLNDMVDRRASFPRPMDWRVAVAQAAKRKEAAEDADQCAEKIIQFLSQIFVPAKDRMTPAKGLMFLEAEVADLSDIESSDEREEENGLFPRRYSPKSQTWPGAFLERQFDEQLWDSPPLPPEFSLSSERKESDSNTGFLPPAPFQERALVAPILPGSSKLDGPSALDGTALELLLREPIRRV